MAERWASGVHAGFVVSVDRRDGPSAGRATLERRAAIDDAAAAIAAAALVGGGRRVLRQLDEIIEPVQRPGRRARCRSCSSPPADGVVLAELHDGERYVR